MKVLSFFLKTHANNPKELDAIVGVSAALQASPEQYKSALNNSFQDRKRSDLKIIYADTSDHQIELITQGLSDVNVGQNTYQIGYKSINTLYLIYHEHDVDELNYTSLKICKKGTAPLCLLSEEEEKTELIN
jgi:ABC-type sugar transport system substrate-binding protein